MDRLFPRACVTREWLILNHAEISIAGKVGRRAPAVLNATESRSELWSVSSRVRRKRHYARLSSSEGAILATTALRRAANRDSEAV